MSRPTLSIYGLYQYDNSLFDNLHVPTGINKDTVVDNIVIECAELETIYPSIPFLKVAIGKWSDKEIGVWTKMYETTQFEYNPIYNKDAYYEEDDTETHDLLKETQQNQSGESNTTEERNLVNHRSETHDLEGNQTFNNLKDTTNEINKVSAYDEINFQNRDQKSGDTTRTGSITDTDEGTITHHDTDTGSVSQDSSGNMDFSGEETDTGTIKHENRRREYGNIGVTTTQKMIQEERDLATYNVIDIIVQSFKERFCILVY